MAMHVSRLSGIELKHSRTQGLKNAVLARFASRMARMANDEPHRLAICI
jgi:hypothetical protein